jgi:tetratricopeptide (TPR) repeat protein
LGHQWPKPPKNLSQPQHGDPTYNMDTLFEALKIAPDDESAKAIEGRIWSLWTVSGSDTCNLLMGRVKAAADAKDYNLAIKLLNAIITIGLLLQDIGDDKHALEAYRKALAIDPHLEHIPDVVRTLSEKVEGRDI